MTGTIHETTIKGTPFQFWADFMYRGSFAKNTETGETKAISCGSYIRNDLTARKAIAAVFGLDIFRK